MKWSCVFHYFVPHRLTGQCSCCWRRTRLAVITTLTPLSRLVYVHPHTHIHARLTFIPLPPLPLVEPVLLQPSVPLEPHRAQSNLSPQASLPIPNSWVSNTHPSSSHIHTTHSSSFPIHTTHIPPSPPLQPHIPSLPTHTLTTHPYSHSPHISSLPTHTLTTHRGCPTAVPDRQGSRRMPVPADIWRVVLLCVAG